MFSLFSPSHAGLFTGSRPNLEQAGGLYSLATDKTYNLKSDARYTQPDLVASKASCRDVVESLGFPRILPVHVLAKQPEQ